MPDSVTITIAATTMEGLDAQDPQVTVEVIQVIPDNRPLYRQVIPGFDGSATITFSMPDGFPSWQVNVTFSRYAVVSGFIFQPKGDRTPSWKMQLTRLPNAWTPSFTPLAQLRPERFDPFTAVLVASTAVDLKTDPTIFDLSARYDVIVGRAQILAKAALLNLFALCSDEVDPLSGDSWFQHVRKIVRIDQERFLAEVNPEIFENVATIVDGLNGAFKNQGYFTEPDGGRGGHIANIPPQYNAGINLQDMKTLKKLFEQGNLQLTVSFLIVDGVAVHLLDCDLDEHANLILHGLDVLAHIFNGGTNPIFMHEYIVRDSEQNSPGGIATIDLGYRLE
jgi:hypothetical protein